MVRRYANPAMPTFGDPDAEELVIGYLFWAENQQMAGYEIVSELLSDECFSSEKHKLIFGAMRRIWQRGAAINELMVRRELEKTDDLERVGSLASFREAQNLVNLESYCKVIADHHRRKMLYMAFETGRELIASQTDVDQILEQARRSLNAVEETIPSSDVLNPEQILVECGGPGPYLSPENMRGIMTPWRSYNFQTLGFVPGELTIWGAKPGVGKTTAALNVAWNCAKNQHVVRMDQYEMLPKRLLLRLHCGIAQVSLSKVRRGYDQDGAPLTPEEKSRLELAIEETLDYKDYLQIARRPPRTVNAIDAAIRKSHDTGRPIELEIVDYIQKMSGVGRFERRDLEVASIAVGLKEISRTREMPVLALAQLSVSAREQFQQNPTGDDFGESKKIGAEADIAMIMRLAGPEEIYNHPRHVNWYPVKVRDGEQYKIRMIFDGPYLTYREATVEKQVEVQRSVELNEEGDDE